MVTIVEDFQWSVRRGDDVVLKNCSSFTSMPYLLQSVDSITKVTAGLTIANYALVTVLRVFPVSLHMAGGKFMGYSGLISILDL